MPIEQRKLAAIMFTDMVGYSALSQRDDKLALELLEEHRQLLREIFPRFNGTEIKTIGDAFLIEFNSALEAAQCAIEIQRTLAKRNCDVPNERRIELKIGIHIGDVVHRGGDVYGDGVNIASRIEPLAGAGGICVSMDVERQIRNALEARFEKLAPTELKNISVAMDLFRIVLPWEQPSTKSEIRSQKSEIGKRPITSTSTKWIGIAALTLLAVGLVWWFARPSDKQAVSSPGVSVSRATPATGQKSIAVLPFLNMSADRGDEYLSDGMTEELLNVLTKVKGLRVPGRSSSFAFKGRNEEDIFRKVGEQLHVNAVLEGSVRKAGDKLRITAQLINVADGFHLWSETYDRDMTDIFAIQTDVAQKVAAALRVQLGVEETRDLVRKPTEDVQAYSLLLQGRFFYAKWTKEGFITSIDLLNQAVQRDPKFALAYAQLAEVQTVSIYLFGSPRQVLPKALTAAQKALELDDTLADSHFAMGVVRLHEWKWEEAEREFKTALAINPNHAMCHDWYGWYFFAVGRIDEALREMQRAQELEPLHGIINPDLAWFLIGARQYEKAVAQSQYTLKLDPKNFQGLMNLGWVYVLQGDFVNAVSTIQQAKGLEPDSGWVLKAMGWLNARSGKRAEAIEAIRNLERDTTPDLLQADYFAYIYAALGDLDQAFKWLDVAYEQKLPFVILLQMDPGWDILRPDPRYPRFLKKLGLAQ